MSAKAGHKIAQAGSGPAGWQPRFQRGVLVIPLPRFLIASRLTELIGSLEAEYGSDATIRPLLLEFAVAQMVLERIAVRRHYALDEVVRDVPAFATVRWQRAQGRSRIKTAGRAGRGVTRKAARLARLETVIQPHELKRAIRDLEALALDRMAFRSLDRYERRALSKRSRLIEKITGYMISQKFMSQDSLARAPGDAATRDVGS